MNPKEKSYNLKNHLKSLVKFLFKTLALAHIVSLKHVGRHELADADFFVHASTLAGNITRILRLHFTSPKLDFAELRKIRYVRRNRLGSQN
jgi:hypothetical protein